MSLTDIVLAVVGAIVLATAATYGARRWANRRSNRLNAVAAGVTRAGAEAQDGHSTSIPALDPMTLGKLLRSESD
jgi:5-enolpyruvylshikimate-3-phosphate synthase